MALQVSPRRFALLVGADLYLNNGSRKSGGGEVPFIKNLRGCVNDVNEIKDLLHNDFQLDNPHILTSSLDLSCNKAKEPEYCWPTFENIRREFDAICEQAGAGDIIFFYFSGHGAILQSTIKSPPGRSSDPSLITMDFCCGKPALRGWQLNEWLARLNKKQVNAVVILDSCYAGGSWRTEGDFRTPEWYSILNVPADEDAITENNSELTFRNAESEVSWDINPEGFTLMAACEGHEKAVEQIFHGRFYGAFTHGLVRCLKQNHSSDVIVTYRNLRDQIAELLNKQTPRVYGRDKLAFFGDKEPILAQPIFVQLKGENIIIPIGRAHGIRVGFEFTTYPSTSPTIFSIDHVDQFICSSKVQSNQVEHLQRCQNRVVAYRWSLGDDTLQAIIQPILGGKFKEAFHTALNESIVGNIQIIDQNNECLPKDSSFGLIKVKDDGFSIYGPQALTGYDGPVRGLDLKGDNITLARKSAASIAHLARFSQILGLREEASKDAAPFKVILKPEYNGKPLPSGQKYEYICRNISTAAVYLGVFVFSPGFHIKQLYPTYDYPPPVHPGCTLTFNFRTKVPDKLKAHNALHRDIIRTIVTTGSSVSWKSLELPDIWNAEQLKYAQSRDTIRDAELPDFNSNWWIEDKIIFTDNT